MKLKSDVSVTSPISGVVGITVSGSAGTRHVETKNTLTDHMYRCLFGDKYSTVRYIGRLYMNYICIGTGTNAITRQSTQLGNHQNASSRLSDKNEELKTINGEAYLAVTKSATFPPGTLVGFLSEVGLSGKSNGTDLQSGTLVKDSNGDPSPIEVFADDQIVISYTWMVKESVVNQGRLGKVVDTGTMFINGTNHDYTVKAFTWTDKFHTMVPYGGASINQKDFFWINDIKVDDVETDETHSLTTDPVEKKTVANINGVIFASFDDNITQIENISLHPSGYRNSPNNDQCVRIEFDPPIPRPIDHKILIDHTYTLRW